MVLRSIQAGRALAAISVVVFHLSVLLSPDKSLLSRLSHHGNAGVDFFFVLSGFIIYYAHERDIGHPDRLKRYLENRFLRVYPIYWVFTAALVLVVLLAHTSSPIPSSPQGWISTVSLFRTSTDPTPLNVAWTLFYEIAFYSLFALLILNRKAGALAFGLWALVIVAFNHSTPTNSIWGVWTSRLCFNFLLGMAGCWAHRRIGVWAARAFILLGGALLLAAGAYVDRGLGELFGPLIAMAFALLITGFAALERFKEINFGVLKPLGDASYTIYLAHVHVLAPVLRMFARVGLLMLVPADLLFVLVTALSLAVCYGLFMTVERPLAKMLKSRVRPLALKAVELR